jgi:hypothetical protein
MQYSYVKNFLKSNIFKLILVLTVLKVVVIITCYALYNKNFAYELLTNWDARNYEIIALQGYSSNYLYAFSPAYPAMVKGLNYVLNNIELSAFIVTNIFGYIFPLILYKTFNYKTALLVESFPVYVLYSTIPYSDPVYLTFISLSFYLIKKKRVLFSSISYAIAILFFYTIAFSLISYFLALKRKFIMFLPIPLIVGFLIFAGYYLATGDPFLYFTIEKIVWGVKFVLPQEQFEWLLNGWFTIQPWKFLSFRISPWIWLVRNLIFFVFYFILVSLLFKMKEYFYGIYSLSMILPLLFIVGTPAISIPRLLLAAFPAFYAFKGKYSYYIAGSLVSLIIITIWQFTAFFS